MTYDNRKKYVESYVDYIFDRASKDKYHKFETGFKTIVDNPVFRSFRPEELQQIVAGAQVIDWKEIENNAKVCF